MNSSKLVEITDNKSEYTMVNYDQAVRFTKLKTIKSRTIRIIVLSM